MNLISSRVLGAAAVLAAPVLYEGFVTGTVAMETAVQRYIVVALIGPPVRVTPEPEDAADVGGTGQPPPP